MKRLPSDLLSVIMVIWQDQSVSCEGKDGVAVDGAQFHESMKVLEEVFAKTAKTLY